MNAQCEKKRKKKYPLVLRAGRKHERQEAGKGEGRAGALCRGLLLKVRLGRPERGMKEGREREGDRMKRMGHTQDGIRKSMGRTDCAVIIGNGCRSVGQHRRAARSLKTLSEWRRVSEKRGKQAYERVQFERHLIKKNRVQQEGG